MFIPVARVFIRLIRLCTASSADHADDGEEGEEGEEGDDGDDGDDGNRRQYDPQLRIARPFSPTRHTAMMNDEAKRAFVSSGMLKSMAARRIL